MSKNNSRDDFTSKTKSNAAERVGLLCSICGRPTMSASDETPNKVNNIGVAAHICAAAPGGPRYDSKMTSAERKSIENCIWLCENHAKLIDNDVITFPKEKLVSYKRDAEDRMKKWVAEGECFFNNIQKNGVDIKITCALFDRLIASGEFYQLKHHLESLSKYNEAQIQELWKYYQIVYGDTIIASRKIF